MAALAAALVVAYLPGALIYRIPLADRARREAITADERAFWAVILSACWSLSVVLGLAFLGTYRFERLLLTNGVVSGLIVLAWRGRLLYSGSAPRPTWSSLVPLALIAIGLWTYFPPAEYAIGGKDPGTYLNEGVQIAQRGSLVVADDVVSSVPPPYRDLFFPSHQAQWYYGLRFMGFFVDDPDSGRVVGQFPHLFPASIAVGYGLNGLSGARQAVGFWAILGVTAVYFAGARLFGRAAAAAAAGLLAINVIQVWFARYPNAELVMQAFLFAAVLALGRAREGSRWFFGATAGGLLGLLLFLRYDTVLAIGAFAGAAALAPVVRERAGAAFTIVLALVATTGVFYLLGPMRAYSSYPMEFTRDRGLWPLVGLGAAALVLARVLSAREAGARVLRPLVPGTMAVALVALAVYAYFFREEAGRIALHDAMAFRAFGWYVTPPVLAAAVAGAALAIVTRFWRDPAFFLTATTYSVFFFYKTRIVPEHFWTTRRFLAVTLPATLLVFAALPAIVTGGRLPGWTGLRTPGPDRVPGRVAGITGLVLLLALVAPAAVSFWRAAAPVRHHVEYAGLIPQLEQLAARIGDRDLLLVEARNAGSDLHTLALPLAYIYARHVLVFDSPVPDRRQLDGFVEWARTRYADVLFLGGGGTDLLTRRLAAEPLSNGRFQVPEYASPINAYPAAVRRKEFEFGLYRLVPTDQLARGPIDLRIGALDDLHVVRFHARETHSDTGELFRWTQGSSYVLLPGLDPAARQVTIWMSSGGRPASEAAPTVEVSFDGEVLGTAVPTSAMAPHVFALPAALAERAAASGDPVRLRLRVNTWSPAAALGVSDTRDLGVMLTRVEVR